MLILRKNLHNQNYPTCKEVTCRSLDIISNILFAIENICCISTHLNCLNTLLLAGACISEAFYRVHTLDEPLGVLQDQHLILYLFQIETDPILVAPSCMCVRLCVLLVGPTPLILHVG